MFTFVAFAMLISISGRCFAETYVPDSEYTLGGISIGAEKSYIISIYGQPTRTDGKGDAEHIYYGDGFHIFLHKGLVASMDVTEDNGVGTTSGFKVGMHVSVALNKYGSAFKNQGVAGNFYATNGSRSTRRMRITTDNRAVITKIQVSN